ncbi:MAG: hypothetical protein ACLQCU_00695 [Acidimicrobiales bacterium]
MSEAGHTSRVLESKVQARLGGPQATIVLALMLATSSVATLDLLLLASSGLH